jgi:peptidoglycan/LPS O-acetylase OafA/YrhL
MLQRATSTEATDGAPPEHRTAGPARYRPDIDGLRAVAVALVVAFHAFPAAIRGGFIGVDVFFVISGFLITSLILDEQAIGRFSIRAFYARRIRRILPALAVVIAATLVMGWFILFPTPYEKLGIHALAGALFFPNLMYWSEAGYFDVAAKLKPLLHLWSLGVEEQFYLVWPLLLVALWRLKLRMTAPLGAIAAASLIYSAIEVFLNPVAAFYSPLSRLWELGLGGILAYRPIKVRNPEIVSLVGIALIVGTALLLTASDPFPGPIALIPAIGSGMVVVGRSSLLSRRPLVALGLISYPLYLWHWPLLSFATLGGADSLRLRAALIVVSIALAWTTMRFVEFPIRFGSWRRAGVPIAAAMTLAVALAGASISWSGGSPTRYPAKVREVLATMHHEFKTHARVGTCWLHQDASFDRYPDECQSGPILVWGDSYAGLLATGLPKPYAQFTRNGCLPLLAIQAAGPGQCVDSNAKIANLISKLAPRRVILFGAWLVHDLGWSSDKNVGAAAMRETLRKVRTAVSDVVLIGTSPSWAPETLPAVAFKFWSQFGTLPDRLNPASQDYQAADRAMRDVANAEGARFVSVFDLLCNGEGCLTHTPASQSQLLFWDEGHLTIEGATYVIHELGLDRF